MCADNRPAAVLPVGECDPATVRAHHNAGAAARRERLRLGQFVGLQDADERRRLTDPDNKLCAYCEFARDLLAISPHGDCTDPYGDLAHCACGDTRDGPGNLHRLMYEDWREPDEFYRDWRDNAGGLSRDEDGWDDRVAGRTLSEREREDRRFDEQTTERG